MGSSLGDPTDAHAGAFNQDEFTANGVAAGADPKESTMASGEIALMRGIADGRLSRREALKRGPRGGPGPAALAGVLAASGQASAQKKNDKIEPNCIFVCCDEKCDTHCYKCFDWPKPKIATAALR